VRQVGGVPSEAVKTHCSPENWGALDEQLESQQQPLVTAAILMMLLLKVRTVFGRCLPHESPLS
jgi:hypothetical protein